MMDCMNKHCFNCMNCDGLQKHKWRSVCVNCNCQTNEHVEYGMTEIVEIKASILNMPNTSVNPAFTWTPSNLSSDEAHAYMTALPSDKAPLLYSAGAVNRERQLRKQIPPYDFLLASNTCLSSENDVNSFKSYVAERNSEVLSVGTVKNSLVALDCNACGREIGKGKFAVFSDVAPSNYAWHPGCFRCSQCIEILADLIHCFEEKLLCARHYDELNKHRCYTCDQLIFAGEYTKSKGLFYHMEHYNCSQCNNPLTGKRYVLKQDQPTCLTCYEEKFANRCEKCEKPIGTDFKDLSYKGRHWHETCFLCWGCQNSLANQQFVAKDDGLYCPDCYDNEFAQRCDACKNTFKHGMQKFEYSGKKFHHECFTCNECSKPIGNNSFVPKEEGRLICMPCYNDNFAQKCGKCGEVLLQGGVTFRDKAYHRECFLCTTCNVELANLKFATKDELPYCPDCYIKTFAKICEKCNQPIAGLGQATKYVAFEGRQWHANCFMCAECDKSLLGQGFLVCNNKVVCPDCGKNM